MIPMSPQNKALAAVGTIMAIVGLLGVAGIAPLAVACSAPVTNCTPSPISTVAPGFSWSRTGLSVTFTDTSTLSQATGKTVTWSFGDGQTAATSPGGSVTHVYAQAGNYNVTDSLTAVSTSCTSCGTTSVTSSTSTTVSVVGPNGTGGSNVGNGGAGIQGAFNCVQMRNCPSLVAGFSWQANSTRLSVQDASVVANTAVARVTWSWGDGSSTTVATVPFTAIHTYGAFGSFNVLETVTSVPNKQVANSTLSSQSGQNVTLSSGSSGGSSGPKVPTSSSAISIGLLAAGIVLAVWMVLPGLRTHELYGGAAAVVAFVIGWLVL